MSDPSKRTQNKNKYHKKTDDTQYDLTVLKTTKKTLISVVMFLHKMFSIALIKF